MTKFAIILSLLTILLSCQKKVVDPNTLNVGLSGEISTLDPAKSNDTVSAMVIYQVYETLYEYQYLKRPYTVRPLLAESMPRVENNGKRYIIKIRQNIPYQDDPAFGGKTRYLVADDFITQFKRLAFAPTKSSGWWIINQKIVGINKFRRTVKKDFSKFLSTPISGINALDDHTLAIDLIEPYPQMLSVLTMNFTSPLPLEIVKAYKNNIQERMIGTGPFQLKEWTKGKLITMTRFKNHRVETYPTQGDRTSHDKGLLKDAGKTIPFIDGIKFHIIKESQQRWAMFDEQKIDYLTIPRDNYSDVVDISGELQEKLKDRGMKLHVTPTLTYWWLAFNMKDPLIGGNRYLRLAIAHAIDTKRYVKLFTNNVAQRANSIYAPGTPGYDPNNELPYMYDLKKAKMYLAKAGYPNGKNLPTITYDLRGVSTTNKQQAKYIQSQLSKIGIKLTIAPNTFPEYLKKAKQGKLQFWQGGWTLDYPDSENLLQLLATSNLPPGPNSSQYSNESFDKLFGQLKQLPNGDKKIELMRKMESIVHKDVPWIMLFYSRNYVIQHDYLKNFRPSDLIYNNTKYIRLEKK